MLDFHEFPINLRLASERFASLRLIEHHLGTIVFIVGHYLVLILVNIYEDFIRLTLSDNFCTVDKKN